MPSHLFSAIEPAAAPVTGGALLCLSNRTAVPTPTVAGGAPILHFLGRVSRGALLPEAVAGSWHSDSRLCVRSPQTRYVGPAVAQQVERATGAKRQINRGDEGCPPDSTRVTRVLCSLPQEVSWP